MRGLDYFICLAMSVVMSVGGSQFYFLVQRRHWGPARHYNPRIDKVIPFWPIWVWVYSGLFCPVVVALVLAMRSYEMFAYTVFSFLVLLTMQIAVFFLFPVRIPREWRRYDRRRSKSSRMLALLQSYDAVTNSIPSMHVSVSTLAAIHLYEKLHGQMGFFAPIVFALPIVIAFSALFTKQHYVADLAPGALFGWLAYRAANFILSA